MTNYSRHRKKSPNPFIAFLFLLLLLLGSSLTHAEPKGFYELPIKWHDELNHEIKLENFKGSPVVLTMAYSSCRRTCLRTIEKLKDIQKLLDEKSIKAEFVIISLDPAHDTPDQLIKYKKKIGIDLKNWHFLRGSEEETEKLRTLSGITSWKYYDHIIHDFRVFILDKGGNIQHDIRNWNADLKTIF